MTAHVMARIVDHASASSTSVSSRVAAMCTSAGWSTRADLRCDQATNACGYIAADAVVRLREASLAEIDGWMSVTLPDYSQLTAVRWGEAALKRDGTERVLEVADVNALVRQYSHLHTHTQAQEEWWGGAVALDNFLLGALDDFLDDLTGARRLRQHQCRAWVVNTQSSWQQGSHWFTVVLGIRLSSVSSHSENSPRRTLPAPLDPSILRPPSEQSQAEPCAAAASAHACDLSTLFPDPSATLRSALAWVSTAQAPKAAAAIMRACRE